MPSLTDARYSQLLDWLHTDLGYTPECIVPASSDASFRRYFRLHCSGESMIVMDAPPPRENVRPFIKVAGLLSDAGVRVPKIHAADVDRGFLLLSDFGHRDYLGALNGETADVLYADAMASLLALQAGVSVGSADLPTYDETLLRTELGIFREWLLERWLGLALNDAESGLIEEAWQVLIDSALQQPCVCVHRDFHSRNLMVTGTNNPGVLDFQDAVIGPITYDLASLLRDCYIAWPSGQVGAWMEDYRDRLLSAGLLAESDARRFQRWFDLMGMQRHLKAAGIFARLKIRDGKSGYLKDIPRTLGYVTTVGQQYPDLEGLMHWLDRRVLPRLRSEVGA